MPEYAGLLANHLWQSTLFAAAVACVAFELRRNEAKTRYWLWLAASVKFLVPFSLLVTLGTRVDMPSGPQTVTLAAAEQVSAAFEPAVHVFVDSPQPNAPWWPQALAALWAAGALLLLTRWYRRWMLIRAALRGGVRLSAAVPIPVVSSRTSLEPGIFGIFRPVLLLPAGIASRLSPEELDAILAHEMTHVQRRDNLTATLHMVVEALFWFHPLVWWIGSRLVEERERACDEAVLSAGNQPQVYAQGVLNVCKHYLESPLPCASGVTGADLKKRIQQIMSGRIARSLTPAATAALAAAVLAVVCLPIMVGALRGQSTATGLSFEVASVRPSDPNTRGMRLSRTPGGGLLATGVTVRTLIQWAYDVGDTQLTGGPSWMRDERFDIRAKTEQAEGPDDIDQAPDAEQKTAHERLKERARSLLAERFQLRVHIEKGEQSAYLLTVGRNGHKMEPTADKGGITRNLGMLQGKGSTMEMLAKVLGMTLGRPVVDHTGLDGRFKFQLEYAEEGGGKGKDGAPVAGSAADPSGPSIFAAIQDQLGLKLEGQRVPVDVIVIDRLEKPSEN